MTIKTTTAIKNTRPARLIDRKLEGPAQDLIRLADRGIRTTTSSLLGRIPLKKYVAAEKKIHKGYTKNLKQLLNLGVERRWLSSALKDTVTPPPAINAKTVRYDMHCQVGVIGRSLLRLARGRCRNTALCTRLRTPYKQYEAAEKKAGDRYVSIIARLWELCGGLVAMPPEFRNRRDDSKNTYLQP